MSEILVDILPITEYWSEIIRSGNSMYAGLIFRIPPRLWRPIQQVQNEFRKVDPRQLYSKPATFHISVKGVGYLQEDVDIDKFETVLARINKIVSGFEPFQIELKGIGVFPTSIHVKVVDTKGNFKEINTKIAEELKGDVDSSVYDGASYIPHVTLLTFNTKDASSLLQVAESDAMKNYEFGIAGVYETEFVRTNLLLALGPEETQDGAFSYIRSFHLGASRGLGIDDVVHRR